MNRNLTTALAVVTVIALALGSFFALNGGSSDAALAPTAPNNAQQLTVIARDTNGNPLTGVAVQLIDQRNNEVTSGTTLSNGQAILTFTPAAGMYAVTATEPEGYRSRDDKDGGSSRLAPKCDSVYLCIYVQGTAMTDGSVAVTIPDVPAHQQSDLDDLWFELTTSGGTVSEDEDALVAVDPPVVEQDGEFEIAVGSGLADDVIDAEPVDEPVTPGLNQLCFNVSHQPVAEQNSPSGIWVRGEVYGLTGGWVWVEGPSLNGGEPVQIPVVDGRFEGPLGINSYGEHTFDRFELGGDDTDPVDLLGTIDGGPGTTVTVTGAEGAAFDDECFEFEPTRTAPLTDDGAADESEQESAEAAADTEAPVLDEPTTGEALVDPPAEIVTEDASLDAFLDWYVEQHIVRDQEALLERLHPAIPMAFGDGECAEYVAETTGAFTGVDIWSIGEPRDIDVDTPAGMITIEDVTIVEVEFALMDGSSMESEATVAQLDGAYYWLTRCGR
ncbi:MAG: Ig-like domain-containing protein [Actinomycetota bacterium]